MRFDGALGDAQPETGTRTIEPELDEGVEDAFDAFDAFEYDAATLVFDIDQDCIPPDLTRMLIIPPERVNFMAL